MTNGLSPAGLIARSAAFARSLAPRKPFPFRQRRGGVRSALKPASLLLAAAVLLVFIAVDAASSPVQAQDATITSLLSRLDVRVVSSGATTQSAGYDASNSQGSLSPAGFNYPAGFGPWYMVEALAVNQGTTGNPTSVVISVRGTVTSVASSGTHRAHVLPSGASITLHLEGENFSKSYSLKNPNERTVTKCADVDEEGNETERHCRVGETTTEEYDWTTSLPPRLANGDKVIVRLRYKAPRPAKPGTPTVTVPTGKSGALVVEWTVPMIDDPDSTDDSDVIPDPKVRGYEVHLSPAAGETEASGVTKTTGGSTTRLPVLLLDPDTAYDVRVRARTYLASGPWSETATATTNALQGANNPQVELDLNDVTEVKQGDSLPLRLKVTSMPNLHAGAFDMYLGERIDNYDVEFRVLGGIAEWYEYEDGGGGCGGGAFYGGGLTIGEDGEVYHDFGSLMVPDNKSDYGPLYIWLGSGCGTQPHSQFSIGSTANSRATALCVEIADDSNTVPTGRACSTEGSAGHAVDRLTGRFVNVPKSHDGESEFTLRLAFVKDVGISPTSLLEDALAATGGAVTQVQRVDDRSDLFEITVEPDSDEDVTITLSSSGDCGEAGSICTREEDPRKLDNSPTATVAGPILTANFQGLPSQHDGETAFRFRIAFSDEIATDAAEFRDHSVEVWGGEVTRAEPVGQRRDLWEVEVEPASDDMVMVSLKLTQSCAATGAVCTAGGRLLSVVPATMVPGPATWPVQITGEARVGKTLTADSSNLSERYGVQVTSMTYRWLADGARVPGAIGRTYQPDDDQQGKRISVMATYTDDRGNEETVTSGPTEPLAARERIRRATGLPLISGRALVGHTLTADTSLIIDANGLENAVFHYFWEADDDSIPDATDPTYTPVEADVGKEITFIVAWVDDAGHGQNMTSQPTMPVMTAEAAAAVEFRKSLRVAANADGSVTLYWNAPDDEVTGYRILRHRHSLGELDPLVYVADTGSTATAYTDTGMVAGVPHNYRVQAIRDGVLGERTIQIKIFPVRKATNSPATGAPAISGTAQVGETLTADISGIADADGLENVTKNYLWAAIGSSGKIGSKYAYQWLADGAGSGSGDHHAGYNNTTYTLTEDDVGKAMSVRVTFVDDAGYQETLTSAATDAVAPLPQPNSPARGAPTIGGTAQVGETLTVDTSGITDEDGLDDSTFTHQWVREDSVMVASAARSYTPTDGDRGKSVKVRVSFTDDAGNRETRTSTQTATVEGQANGQEGNSPATGLPTISGTAQVGETLTAGITGIADADGLSGETFTYQWVSGDGTTDTDMENATGSTYTLAAADQGRFVKVRVTFTDEGGNEETLTSAPTAPVWGDGPPGAPRNLAATPGNKEVTLSWEPPDDNGNAPATGYRIEWRVDGKDYDKNIWGTARSTSYTTNDQANLANGVKYFFRVRAGNGRGYSYGPASGEVSATPTSGSAVDLGTPVLSNTENLHHGMVQLDWEDVEDAGWYVVQYYHLDGGGGEWVDLPAAGVDIAFHGSSAVVSNLHGLSWLRVRAMSCAGESEWSQIEQSFGTNASDWEGVPVPEVAEGDEIEPCPVVLGTPVLSDTETLHHGMVQLDWEDIEDAGWYVVQYYHVDGGSGEWLDLPAAGVDIAFHGSSAVVSNLHGLSWLRVRAMSCAGESEWSQIEQSFGTNASDWEGVPVPEVAEGDEIEPCSEDADTPDNSPATGAPTISGTARVEETLEADTSGVADADGLSNVQYEYQWLANDSAISGATNATYSLAAADEGYAIKVQVSFTDDAGNEETLTSAATDVVAAEPQTNSPATGAPTIIGTAQVGETLTADTSDIADDDGLNNVQYEYQWLADDSDIAGATGSTYTVADTDEGKAIKVEVTFIDDSGNDESLTSAATDAVAAAPTPNSPATGAPTITGTVQVGDTLTADMSEVADADGLSNVQYEYQWLSDDSDIAGTTGSTYTLADTDEGKAIKVRVSFTDDAGNEETLTSAATDAVAAAALPPPPDNLRAVTQKSGAVELTWDAPQDVTVIGYRIERRPASGDHGDQQRSAGSPRDHHTLVEDTGSADTGYTDNTAQKGVGYEYRVSARNEAGAGEESDWVNTEEEAASNSPATGTPTISGTAQVGKILTADTSGIADEDGLSKVQYEYQWLADDADISGATNAAYTLVAEDEGKAIKVQVSFTDDAGNEETLTSAATAAVSAANTPATGAPTISGTAQVEETLTANTSGAADVDGLSNVQYEYQWLANDSDISGATNATYTLVAADEGKVIKAQVTFTDDQGNEESLTSAGTAAVSAANTPATGAPTIIGTAQVGEALAVDTSGIADADGLGSVQYEYQWLADDSEISGATNATYTLADTDEGKAIKVRVSFTDDAENEETLTSGATAAVVARPDSPTTGAPSISGTAQVGETLAVDTSGIADADGIVNATFSYQWLADDAAIAGATGYTYTLSDTDEGKAIKVQVNFTDDEGNAETLTSAATAAVTAAPPSITPGEPQNLELTPVAVGTNGVGIKVFWDAPSATGGSDISGYRIQWKGGSQDYPDDQETRQAFVDNAPYTIDTSSPTPIEGDELTVRVAAVSGAGAGVWTEKVGWLPSHTDLELWLLMKEYADEKQTTFPWVLETWNYLDRYEVPVEVGPTPGLGSVPLLPCVPSYTDGDDGLKECHVDKFKILQIEDPKPRIIIHEMAHAYSLANRVTEGPGPLAIAHLYFDSLNLQGGLRGCEPRELYADVLTMLTLDIDESSYWKTCNGDNAQREAQALDVLRSAVDGEMPQWFADTYTDAEDEPDLERLWTDVQDLPRIERNVAVYQLRDAFGGYCNNRLTWKSMQYSEDKLTQPWMDGGCPPPEPSSLEVTPGEGELTLAWDAPASDGDSDVEGYIVQWKSVYKSYDDWATRRWRAVLDSPTSLTYTISGLGNGIEYDVRVRAYNAIGPGQPLDVESVTTSEPAIPAIPENTRPTGVPTITGTAQVGEVLTVDTSGISDEDGMESASFTFTWGASGYVRATGAVTEYTIQPDDEYTIQPDDEGKRVYVAAFFKDDKGNWEVVYSALTSVVEARPNNPATGAPSISGTAQVGEALTADTSGIADADGLTNASFTYQWLADDTEIAGATGLTYTLTDSDEGKAIKVQVSFTDDADNGESLTSAATDAVAAAPTPNSPATGAPTISGTAQVGETLTANTSGIADADGLSNVRYEYQWLADDADIAGATGLTYTLADTDEGQAMKVEVTFTDDAGNDETLTSASTDAVAAVQTNSPATGAPTITGTAQVGQTLTADTSGIADADGLGSVQYKYQWLADDAEIADATSSTYTLLAEDEGQVIKVRVSFTDDQGNEESLTSGATDTVAGTQPTEPPDKPTGLEATATHDSVTLTWDDPGDDSITGYVILRRIPGVDPEGQFDELVSDTGTAATTYTDDTVASETRYTYRIKAINGAGTSERSRWVHIDTPAAPVPDKPTGLEATASHNSVTLSWDDPGDDSITGYVILRRVRVNDTGGDFSVLVADTASAATTYTDDTVAPGTTYTYRIKAINEHGVSERSRWYHIDIPEAP